MQLVTDLHLHSKYSRAVSQQMTIPVMAKVARQKGIDLLTASDFTHPLWLKEVKGLLEEAADGVYRLKSEYRNLNIEANYNDKNKNVKNEREVYFIFSTEISSIYSQGGRVRRIHNLVFAPDLETVEKINKEFLKRGANLLADGRPIIGISSHDLLEMILGIDQRCLLIPCHVWTPHFGVYGSASGFDSLSEAFGDLSDYIYGIETGLSSDPEMNWQIPELATRSILSFSDAHSAPKMGREATVMELEKLSYENLRLAIMSKALKVDDRKSKVDLENRSSKIEGNKINPQSSTIHNLPPNRVVYTIEFYPEEGKYHFSGHRNCKVVYGPDEIRSKGNTCPVCKRRLTEGVLFRVQQLADPTLSRVVVEKRNAQDLKWFTHTKRTHPPYVKLVPLLEIVAEGLESTVMSQKVRTLFDTLTSSVGSEIDILLKTPIADMRKVSGSRVAEGIERVRKGTIAIDPGFDGEYGKVAIWRENEETTPTDEPQLSLDI